MYFSCTKNTYMYISAVIMQGVLYSETNNMTGNEINFIVEQRAHTKIRVLLGYSATDIKHDLDKVSGTSALSYLTILLLFHLLSI
jgi:hypothetical protein